MSPTAPNVPPGGADADAVTVAEIRRLGAVDQAPCVSLLMPTARYGTETLQGPVRLRNLLSQARTELAERAASDGPAPGADELLAPIDALVDDRSFWQHQAEGLALYAWPGSHARYRVPLHLPEVVAVGDRLRVRSLLPLLAARGRFHLLALSQDAVRLFDGSARGLTELDPGPMPTSIDAALAHEDHERQLQVRSGGGATAQYHGHGLGDELDKATVERFLRAVDRGVTERVGATPTPLVLAGVAYYGPIYRSVTGRRNVLEAMVEGSPDHAKADELHARAWPLVAPVLAGDHAAHVERIRAATGTGLATTDPGEVADRAVEGRVDTLLVTADPITDAAVEDTVDRAVAAALTTSARVLAADDGDLVDGEVIAALLRY